MPDGVQETVKSIKKSLRLAMNGVVSTLQRRQGLDYKINFGVEIPRLKGIAAEYPKAKEVSFALWQDNIRECKLLAIFLLPEEEYCRIAEKWIEETRFTEIADHLAMNILCRLTDAEERAIGWIAKENGLYRYCGYATLSNIVRNGGAITEWGEMKFISAAADLLNTAPTAIDTRCALNALARYLDAFPEAAERIQGSRLAERTEVGKLLKNIL